MQIRINIEQDIDTCVHCPFWAMYTTQNIQYCHYNERNLDTSQTTHPPVPDWCPFIKDEHEIEEEDQSCLTTFRKKSKRFLTNP